MLTRHNRRGFRVILVLLLALALSAVSIAGAQSTSTALPQVVSTSDGQLSVHLPADWLSQEASPPIYSSTLAFGDSPTALQGAVDSLTATQTKPIPGVNGVIAILGQQYTAALDPTTGVSILFTTVTTELQQSGATILNQQLTDAFYEGSVAVVEDTNLKEKGIVGVLQSGKNYIIFQIGVSPEANFDADSQMLMDIVSSIQVPAESVGAAQPTTAAPTAVAPSGQSGQPGQDVVTASKSGVFSVHLPQGWATDLTATIPNFGDTITFGSDQQALQTSSSFLVSGQRLNTFQGIGGLVGVIQLQGLAGVQLDQLVAPLIQGLTASATSTGAKTVGQAQTHTFGGQYPGEVQQLDIGVIGVMHSDTQVVIAIVISDDPTANSAEINTILESIRVPAEAGEQQGTPATQTTPSGATQTFRSSDQRVSLDIPGDWTVLDHVADGDILAYGDTADAAMSRLYSVKPDLATKTVISGNGGVVVIYPMSQFGIDPNNPDLMPLIQRALSNLQGYTVEQQPQPLDGVAGAVIAVIGGTEHGYLALIPFGDQIAYVTATVSSDSFDANQSALLAIVKSVHIPAVPESSGLGGLGGLEATQEATPVVTAEPSASGLGGLGGLEVVPTEAATPTPEKTPKPNGPVATPEVTPGA